jgi:adenosylcobyric acid synthase
MPARALMIGGTASHVGKSWIATAICRSLHRKGVRVAPFKAQNMSNNSYPCPGGGEIGRAQVAQAQACGLEPSPDMNPILLKPSADATSQVVVHGQVWRNLSAADYYRQYDFLVRKVDESYARLAAQYDFIVIEGAGGIAELNLRRMDLVNLGLAQRLNVPVLLVADIDRGGVFASICGTISLLEPEEAALVRAFAVNRFRGDPALFADAVPILEAKTGRPCLGVFPYVHDVDLDEEDSVALDHWQPVAHDGPAIAIIQFPRVSNHTDFQRLSSALWIQRPSRRQFDLVILPGSKNSVADLEWMRQQKFDLWLKEQHAGGAHILGVCGGYQMMGESIDDPYHVESDRTSVPGLRMLPVRTTLLQKKVTQRVAASTPKGRTFSAYEIHMGETSRPDNAEPFAWIDGRPEGVRHGRCAGTYLHSALENPDVLEDWIGFRPPEPVSHDDSYNRLADWFERWVDGPKFESLFLA